jgi:hypothetical protein
MGVAASRHIKGALGVLAAAILAVMLAAAPMRMARASAATARTVHPAALTEHVGPPAPHHPVRVLTPKYFDKHVVDAFLPAAVTGSPLVPVQHAGRLAPAQPVACDTEVCSRGPPAGELLS